MFGDNRLLLLLPAVFVGILAAEDAAPSKEKEPEGNVTTLRPTPIAHKLTDLAVHKMQGKVLLFACAVNDYPPMKCKVSESMTICHTDSDVMVLGIPLGYTADSKDYVAVADWIDDCMNKGGAKATRDVMKRLIERIHSAPHWYNSPASRSGFALLSVLIFVLYSF